MAGAVSLCHARSAATLRQLRPRESVRPFPLFFAIIRRFRVDKATDLADKTAIKVLLWPEATTMNVNATGVPLRRDSIRL
jgi:hypothetical protein